MSILTFDVIAKAWHTMLSDEAKVLGMKTFSPTLTRPNAIRIKKIKDDDSFIILSFYGFDAASDKMNGIPTIKRMIFNWIKKFAYSVQVIDSGSTNLNLKVSTMMRFDEAAIPIFKRDPKTNKIKKVYKCIGGYKNGRRVSDKDQCLRFPDVAKRIRFGKVKRASRGLIGKNKTKTKLTNLVSRRLRKANVRLKNARGF